MTVLHRYMPGDGSVDPGIGEIWAITVEPPTHDRAVTVEPPTLDRVVAMESRN
jgi:hypothetical protein